MLFVKQSSRLLQLDPPQDVAAFALDSRRGDLDWLFKPVVIVNLPFGKSLDLYHFVRCLWNEQQIALLVFESATKNVPRHPIVADFDPIMNRVVVAILAAAGMRSMKMNMDASNALLENNQERRISLCSFRAGQRVEHQTVIVLAVQLCLQVLTDNIPIEREPARQDVIIMTVAPLNLLTSNAKGCVWDDDVTFLIVHMRG